MNHLRIEVDHNSTANDKGVSVAVSCVRFADDFAAVIDIERETVATSKASQVVHHTIGVKESMEVTADSLRTADECLRGC